MDSMPIGCRALAGLLVVLFAGCGGEAPSASVSGDVTYEGQPVTHGSIAFQPVDGHGPSSGAPIEDGKFQLPRISPGPKIVQIVAVKKVNFARTSEEMEQMSKASASQGDKSGIIDRADVIPADAEGNNAKVEVKPGQQQMNFALKRSPVSQ